MRRESGIILKTFFPKKRKMVVLDWQLGKIEAVPPSDQYCSGSMLEYTLVPWRSVYMLQEINVIDVPLVLGRHDIQFLHHMLELCYFCAPFHQIIQGLYELIHDLYHYIPTCNEELIKLAYILKGMHLLGLHPEEGIGYNKNIYDLAEKSIDTIVNKILDLEFKQEIQDWVFLSLKSHPLHLHFKTFFFREMGS